ncbi:hypothetical protein PoB_004898500 [Plakobranchus ocellatus]|uniref:Uncharacterized protein n=1 Tax=Plakobranchus ocellatus TaxID=259542 RepID=A0AAV4BPH5_9GAST|nr:hypothetical protein PoB_004898500 [Plakobranchus ocellatus]
MEGASTTAYGSSEWMPLVFNNVLRIKSTGKSNLRLDGLSSGPKPEKNALEKARVGGFDSGMKVSAKTEYKQLLVSGLGQVVALGITHQKKGKGI